jgi:hypothetical protein
MESDIRPVLATDDCLDGPGPTPETPSRRASRN